MAEKLTAVAPYLTAKDIDAALDFCVKVFGATDVQAIKVGGMTLHAELKVNGESIMFGPENPEWGSKSAQTLGGSPVGVHVYVDDVDATFAKALEAGAAELMPPTEMFWGDKHGRFRDPATGIEWSVATHIRDVPQDEMQKAAEEWMASQAA